MSSPSENCATLCGSRAACDVSDRGMPVSKVPNDSPARAASARAICAENIIADRRGIISCVLPSIAAMPSGREAASPRPSEPNCSERAADRARDTLSATGSQMRFHVGIVCSTHATLLHTSRVTGPEAKSVTASSHRSATVIA